MEYFTNNFLHRIKKEIIGYTVGTCPKCNTCIVIETQILPNFKTGMLNKVFKASCDCLYINRFTDGRLILQMIKEFGIYY